KRAKMTSGMSVLLSASRSMIGCHEVILDLAAPEAKSHFLEQGHLARHLRRMRVAYRKRLECAHRRRGRLLPRRAPRETDPYRAASHRRSRRRCLTIVGVTASGDRVIGWTALRLIGI